LPQARTIAEVIAGEATHGTREQRYADMLGIASVISNRSTVTGVPADSIISAPRQFDAYGKSLPPGTNAYTGLAQQAWDQVQTTGPVHPGTYYATPSATKNLPSGLVEATATTGHKYFVDPAARAIRTAVGTIKPSIDAVAGLVQNTIGAVTNAVGGLLPDSAPAPTARPSQGLGMAALAPNGLNYDLSGARRNQVPTSGIGLKVADVAGNVIPGSTTNLFSGMEPPGSRPVNAPNRHPLGFAGDFTFRDAIGQPVTDPVALHDIAMGMAAKHNANIGFGPEYMGRQSMHIDTMPVGPGGFPGGQQWGSLGKDWAGNLNFARETGIGPTPYSGAPTPFGPGETNPNSLRSGNVNATPQSEAYAQAAQGMQEAGVRGLGATQQFSAPVEKVERGPALSAPSPARPDNTAYAGPSFASPVRPDNAQFAGPVGNFSVPSKPSDATLAAAYGQMANTMGQVGVQGLGSQFGSIALGTPPATPVAAPIQAPTPVHAMPPPVQQPVAPPVARPVRAPVHAPVQTTERLAPVNSFTPGDIYGGQIGSALASGGNTVSRDALGRTSVTNKHGVTTVSMPDGKQAAFGGPSIGAPSQPSGLGGFMPSGEKIGGMVKGGLGAVAGAQLGGLLGPVGAVLGGYIGSQIAQGKNPLTAFSKPGTGKGLGYFPGAPAPSKKSFRDMPDINFDGFGSGQRASASEANRGGRGVTAGGTGLW
jgi:hypothetical protein